ncbi:MAG: glutathione synthase, partial [Microcystaceae cyanobacterium]
MKLAFIIDLIARLDPTHDTTVALMEAAQEQGHEVWITEVHQLSVINGQAWANLQAVKLIPVTLENGLWVAVPQWYELSEP